MPCGRPSDFHALSVQSPHKQLAALQRVYTNSSIALDATASNLNGPIWMRVLTPVRMLRHEKKVQRRGT